MKPLLTVLSLLLLVTVAGCSSGTAPSADPTNPAPATNAPQSAFRPATPSGKGPDVAQPVLASSELVVGPERFVFGLVSSRTGLPINDVPVVGLQFFKVNSDGTATKVSDGTVVYHSENLPAGLFVAQTSFKEAGTWGALVSIRRAGSEPYQAQLNFEVLARGNAPMIGDLSPASKNLTVKDVKDLAEIDSAAPHDDMHSLTIADAVKSGKPTLILFATPGFCETLTCGPDLEVAQAIEKKYAGKANFVHIETPGDHELAPKAQAPTVQEWGLKTEPWIFLVGSNGKIANRFEGGLPLDEVEPAFAQLVGSP